MMKSEVKAELESVFCNGIEFFSKTFLKDKVLEFFSFSVSSLECKRNDSTFRQALLHKKHMHSKTLTSNSSSL